MDRQTICIYKDLYCSRNLSDIEKFLITQIRYGNERFEHFTAHIKRIAEYCDQYYDESELKICYDKLVAYGLIKTEETTVQLEGRDPFKGHYDTIDENFLKKII